MSVQPSEVLRLAGVRLDASWNLVSQEWRDEVAGQFAKVFMADLQKARAKYFEVVQEVESILDEVASDG